MSKEAIMAELQRRGVQVPAQPVGVDKQAILAELQRRGVQPPQQEPDRNRLAEFGAGYIQGGKNVVSGILQTGADVAGAMFPESKGVQDFRGLVTDAYDMGKQRFEEQTPQTAFTKAGQVAGEVTPYLAALPTGGATLGGRVAAGAAGGAIAGATGVQTENLTPEQALTERGKDAAISGAIGGAVPVVMKGVTKVPNAIKKFADINPVAFKDFADSGVQMSLASISNRPSVKLADKWLSRFVGSADVMQKNTAKTLDDIKSMIDDAGVSKAVTKQEAGAVIQEGAANYIDRFKSTSGKLYNRVDKYIQSDSIVSTPNTISTLNEVIASAPTPKLQARQSQNQAVKLLKDLIDDSENGGLPYKALKQYRTLIGQELSTPHLIGGTDIAVYKKAYAALSQDMEAAAKAQGSQAYNAFKKANDFYNKGVTNIEKNLEATILKNTPEEAYKAAISGTKEGGTRISSIMRSLNPQQKEIVSGTVLKQMGLAKPGAQDASGEMFSAGTFLTNWNKLSPEAKQAIFNNKKTSDSLNKIARLSNYIKEVDRFGNPSGTAQQLGFSGVLLGLLTAPVTTTSGVVGANATARLMTNQKFINWLANAAESKTPQVANKQISRLSSIARENPNIAQDIAQYLTTISIISNRGE